MEAQTKPSSHTQPGKWRPRPNRHHTPSPVNGGPDQTIMTYPAWQMEAQTKPSWHTQPGKWRPRANRHDIPRPVNGGPDYAVTLELISNYNHYDILLYCYGYRPIHMVQLPWCNMVFVMVYDPVWQLWSNHGNIASWYLLNHVHVHDCMLRCKIWPVTTYPTCHLSWPHHGYHTMVTTPWLPHHGYHTMVTSW